MVHDFERLHCLFQPTASDEGLEIPLGMETAKLNRTFSALLHNCSQKKNRKGRETLLLPAALHESLKK
jgi:hypothetical protein